MIDLYTWGTPNGRKISIALEELGLPYTVHSINIMEGEQRLPHFTSISPNQKIPAILDRDTGTRLMESGAILLYLAKKTGQLISNNQTEYWETVEWLMWQKAGLGPMLGQLHHFIHFNPGKSSYAETRYLDETARLYGVLDQRLAHHPYLVGEQFSVTDIACWPWIARFEWQQIDLKRYPHVLEWYQRIAARPSVQAGYSVPDAEPIPMPDRGRVC